MRDEDRHLTEDHLRSSGETPASPAPDLARHLAAGCEECLAVLRRSLEPAEDEPGIGRALAPTLDRAASTWRRITEELRQGPELMERLAAFPPDHQTIWARSASRYRRPSMVRQLCAASDGQLSTDVEEAVRLAGLAVDAAAAIEEPRYGQTLAEDMRCRAHVTLARAVRRSGDLARAARLLARAEEHRKLGSRDALELGLLLEERSNLYRARRRFGRSIECLERAMQLYERLGLRHAMGRILVKKVQVLGERGDNEAVPACAERAVRLLDPRQEPRWMLALIHNLALSLTEVGRTMEALQVLATGGVLYLVLGRQVDFLRARWVTGTILLEEGRLDEAAFVLKKVCRDLAEQGLPYETAVAAVELALAEARREDVEGARRALAQAVPFLEGQRLERELLSALELVRELSTTRAIDGPFIERIEEILRGLRSRGGHRGQSNPGR